MKTWLPKVSYFLIGLLLGVNIVLDKVTGHIDYLNERALVAAKISFLRGCVMRSSLEDCKAHPGYTDYEEIFKNIDDVIEQSEAPPTPRAPFKEQEGLSLAWKK